MKAELPLAAIGIAIAMAAAVLWMSAPASAPTPPSDSFTSTSAMKSAQPAGKSIERTNQARPPAGETPAELLARIQNALHSTNLDERDIALPRLLAALVRADPLAAARFAEANPGDMHDLVLHRVAQLWAAQDISAALDWAVKLPSAPERDEILTDVCLQVAESDPEEAVRIRCRYVPDEKPDPGLEALTQRWAETDFPVALDWAMSRRPGEQRNQLIARLAYVESKTAPSEAATLVAEKIPAGPAQTEAVIAVLHQWALRDPAAAKQWIARFPESDLRTRALDELDSVAQSRPESND